MSSDGRQVNVHEAKTHLSRLLVAVEAGEEIVIARAGRPVARLVPVKPPGKFRTPGRYEGQGWISPEFDAPLPEDVVRLFEGGAEE